MPGILSCLALVATMLPVHGVALAAEAPRVFAVTGATVHTLQPGALPLKNGVVVVTDGRISCLGELPSAGSTGKTCVIPATATVHALPGCVLVPGMVDVLGRAGQIEIDAEESSHDGVSARASNLAEVQAIDGVQLHSRAITAARHGGVTVLLARPMGGALITGQSVAFRTQGQVIDDALVRNPVAMHVNLGEEAKVDMPLVGARSGQIALLRTLLARAQRLAAAQGGAKAKDPAERESLQRLRDDPGIAALVPVVQRKLPLVVHAGHADDIAAALRLREQFSLELIIAGGAEAYLLADRLAAAKVPVLLGPVRMSPDSFATARATPEAAAILFRAGVLVGLATAETHNARNLRWEAGFAVAAGLPWAAGLAAITRNVGQILHLGPGVGMLELGQAADFAVYDGDPLSLDGHVRLVSIRGIVEDRPDQL